MKKVDSKKGGTVKQGSTLFLRLAIWLIGLFVLSLCLFALPPLLVDKKTGLFVPVVYGLYIAAIPFFYALYQTLSLLDYIDDNKAFSRLSIMSLKNIKYCAVIIAVMFSASLPYIHYIAATDADGPGPMVPTLIIALASTVIATFAAVLQKLVQTAVEMKEEHDLTV